MSAPSPGTEPMAYPPEHAQTAPEEVWIKVPVQDLEQVYAGHAAPLDQPLASDQHAALMQAAEPEHKRRFWNRKPRSAEERSLRKRRLIVTGVLLLLSLGLISLFLFTDLFDPLTKPLLAQMKPVQQGIDWVLADPKRAWAALAVAIIPHVGLYFMIFEDRR